MYHRQPVFSNTPLQKAVNLSFLHTPDNPHFQYPARPIQTAASLGSMQKVLLGQVVCSPGSKPIKRRTHDLAPGQG
jgi:hypothetical protein